MNKSLEFTTEIGIESRWNSVGEGGGMQRIYNELENT